VYESLGARGRGVLVCAGTVIEAAKCNALEDEIDIAEVVAPNAVAFSYRPFEIITLKLSMA
jgi:alpha-mannosidase